MTPDHALSLGIALLLVALWASKPRSWLLRWSALAVAVSLSIQPVADLLKWVRGWWPL